MDNEIIFQKILQEFSETLPRFPDGRIDYSRSDKAPVLTCFVWYADKILLLKRSDQVRSYQGLWGSVAGYLDDMHPPEEKALEELHEELGISPEIVERIKLGEPYEFLDYTIQKTWIIFPVLVELNQEPTIHLDWEHTDFQWIYPTDLQNFDIVPNLDQTLARVI